MAQPGRSGSAVAPEHSAEPPPALVDSAAELSQVFHRLNNQLGVILANAELLEHRLADEPLRTRAEQVVTGTLDAINTAQHLRKEVWANAERKEHPTL